MAKVAKKPIDEIKDLITTPAEKRESGWELDLNDLYAKNSKYTPEQKLYAVLCYMVEGTSVKAGKVSGVDPATIRWWKAEASWWAPALKELRRQYQDQLDAKFTGLIHSAVKKIEERIEIGDEVIDKYGDLHHKAISARDMTMILAILYDKRALLRGDPTSNAGKVGSQELDALTQRFENFAKEMEQSGALAKPIEGIHQISGEDILNPGDNNNERESK